MEDLPSFEELLLRGALGQILERSEWWRAWEQDRESWVRDAGLWYVVQRIHRALSLRSAMDELLQGETHTWLAQVNNETHEGVKLKLQKKILRALALTPVASLETGSNPYSELSSYFEAQSLRDKSQAMDECDDARLISWPTVRALYREAQALATQRFMAVIIALDLEAQDIPNLIQNLLPCESSHSTIKTITVLVQAIMDQLAFVRAYVNDEVAILFERMASVSDELKCLQYEPLPTLLLLDNAMSSREQRRLCAQFARLERQVISKTTDKRYAHRDVALIDPFMYPYLSDATRIMDEEEAALLGSRVSRDPHERMLDGMFLQLERPIVPVFICGYYYDSHWIPSDFLVDEDGDVAIKSYINNLHPLDYRQLYGSIGHLFKAMVPLFERILGRSPFKYRKQHVDAGSTNDEGKTESPSPFLVECPEKAVFSLRGRQVQVVVAAMNMHLTPDQPRHERGDWHLSGRYQDRIVATCLYCFAEANATVQRLSFASSVGPFEDVKDHIAMQQEYGVENALTGPHYQPQGSIALPALRAVVFGHSLSHRLEGFELQDPSQPGYRKFLAFHLVDPEHPIPSGRRVPPQQLDWAVEFLDRIWKARDLPESVGTLLYSFIFANDEKWTQEMALARRHRHIRHPF